MAGFGPVFERAGDGGADGNDAVTGCLGGFDGGDSFGRDVEPLGVHVMFFDLVAADREESAEADVKGKILDLDAFGSELAEELFGHVEAGGWSGGRAELFGPNGLIAFDVVLVGIAMEVWREWDVAVIGDNFGKVARGGDGGGAIAENFFDSDNTGGFAVVGDVFDGKLVAGVELAAIHDVVDFAVVFLENDELAWAAVRELGKNARTHDAGVVENN